MDNLHGEFYKNPIFYGPSLHFHKRCIDDRRDFEKFSELVYALLPIWGMHRVGEKGPKVKEFNIFKNSLNSCWKTIELLQSQTPITDNNEEALLWEKIRDVFFALDAMQGKSQDMYNTKVIVANSKIMAHAIPNLVGPIDRKFTLKYLFESDYVPEKREGQWKYFKKITQEFYYYILKNEDFSLKSKKWMSDSSSFCWDTSELKIIDNLVISAQSKK